MTVRMEAAIGTLITCGVATAVRAFTNIPLIFSVGLGIIIGLGTLVKRSYDRIIVLEKQDSINQVLLNSTHQTRRNIEYLNKQLDRKEKELQILEEEQANVLTRLRKINYGV